MLGISLKTLYNRLAVYKAERGEEESDDAHEHESPRARTNARRCARSPTSCAAGASPRPPTT